ncbi:MAG: helix-turn-helix domain-containing protein [Bdellovibrionales bacterium]
MKRKFRSRRSKQFDIDIGAKLREARMMSGMSQEKLAEALGITFQQIQKYEKGTNRISSSRWQQISRALNRPVSWFFGEAESGSPAITDGVIGDTVSVMARLDPESKRIVRNVAKLLQARGRACAA